MGQKLFSRSNINYTTTVAIYNVGVQSDQDENCQDIVRWIVKRCHYLSRIYLPYFRTPCRFLEGSVYTGHGPNIHVSEKVDSGRDAFLGADIFLQRSVTKHYSLTLKTTASVLHVLRKRVRELLMVYENRWLTL